MIPNLPGRRMPRRRGRGRQRRAAGGGVRSRTSYGEHQRVPHWEIGEQLGILDIERAVKLSGSMFVMYREQGAALVRALCQLALDRNVDLYEEVRPPTLVRTETMISTGHLPKFEEEAYHIERDDLWAIPTAEVPLTSLGRDEILRRGGPAPAVLRPHVVLPPRGGLGGQGHPRAVACPRVRQGRDPGVRHARPGGRSARRDPGPGRGAHRRARVWPTGSSTCAPVTSAARRPARSTSRCTRRVSTAGSRCRSVSWFRDYQARRANLRYRPSRRQGHRDPAHPQRFGPGGAPGVGGARRDVPPARRHASRSRSCCSRTCAARPRSREPRWRRGHVPRGRGPARRVRRPRTSGRAIAMREITELVADDPGAWTPGARGTRSTGFFDERAPEWQAGTGARSQVALADLLERLGSDRGGLGSPGGGARRGHGVRDRRARGPVRPRDRR